MRLLSCLLLSSLLSSAACAAELSRDIPPPPPMDKAGSDSKAAPATDAPPAAAAPADQGEPQVTITKKDEQTIEEYRVGGRLYMIKVIPKHGKPYYLVDDLGDGRFVRQDGLDTGLRPPRWVIHRW